MIVVIDFLKSFKAHEPKFIWLLEYSILPIKTLVYFRISSQIIYKMSYG